MQDRLWKRMAVGSVLLVLAGVIMLSEHYWGHAPFWAAGEFFVLGLAVSVWCLYTYRYHKDWE